MTAWMGWKPAGLVGYIQLHDFYCIVYVFKSSSLVCKEKTNPLNGKTGPLASGGLGNCI